MTAPADRPAVERGADRPWLVVGIVLSLVALGVAVVVGRHDGEQGTPARFTAASNVVDVQLRDMDISPSAISVPIGSRLVLRVTNTDEVRHDLRVDGRGATPLLTHGQSARLDLGTVTADARAWCGVPGHAAAGMTMTISVTRDGVAAADDGMAGMAGMNHPSPAIGQAATIDFTATPGAGWRPYDPALRPVEGGRTHRTTLTVRSTDVEVAPGVRQTLWTYNGSSPGPVLHGRVGDVFVVRIVNDTDQRHGIDFHAGAVAPDAAMRPLAPGRSLTYEFTARYAGAWLYHCSTMPMSLHMANGMFGAVVVDPPGLRPVAAEYAFVQSELYLGGQDGVADEAKIDARSPDAVAFNGYVNQYAYRPLSVGVGERVRVWVVDAGPQFPTSFHVVGTQFDTVFKEGAYLLRPSDRTLGGAQALDLAPAQGGFVEFTLPEPGHYPFVDHAMVDAEHGARGVFVAS
jgi:nitrite reductase (NO-forming)